MISFFALVSCSDSGSTFNSMPSDEIIPNLIREVSAQPPQFSPNYQIDRGTFTDPFVIVENNKLGSYSLSADPADETLELVESFYVDGTECRGVDCNRGSVRSLLREDEGARQKEAWYSFEIFIPNDFPIESNFKGRFYLFAEFKEIYGCATTIFGARTFDKNGSQFSISHLYIRPDRLAELEVDETSFERCSYRFQRNVARLENMQGRWNRFEYFINWSTQSNGEFLVFLDGVKVIDYNGPTCSTETRCLERNMHYYGIYTPNNNEKGGLRNQEPAEVLYRNVSRAPTREQLRGFSD